MRAPTAHLAAAATSLLSPFPSQSLCSSVPPSAPSPPPLSLAWPLLAAASVLSRASDGYDVQDGVVTELRAAGVGLVLAVQVGLC